VVSCVFSYRSPRRSVVTLPAAKVDLDYPPGKSGEVGADPQDFVLTAGP
jgi:hypothetical protein